VSIEFRSTAHADHVRVEMRGEFLLEEVLALCDRCFQAAAAAGRETLLVDARGMGGREPTMAERYQWAVRVAELQAAYRPRIRVALLGREPLIHPERFGEIVATGHGAELRTFVDEDLALDWLLGRAAAT
jgi:hypothetical protein